MEWSGNKNDINIGANNNKWLPFSDGAECVRNIGECLSFALTELVEYENIIVAEMKKNTIRTRI